MSAVLRAYGAEFAVDEYVAGCKLPICAVIRRGEPVFPNTQPNGRRHEQSGVHIIVSDAEFEQFPQQVEDAIAFLNRENDQLRALCQFPGVEAARLDFGVARRDVAVQCDYLPPDLIRIASELGLGVEISLYWAVDEPPARASES